MVVSSWWYLPFSATAIFSHTWGFYCCVNHFTSCLLSLVYHHVMFYLSLYYYFTMVTCVVYRVFTLHCLHSSPVFFCVSTFFSYIKLTASKNNDAAWPSWNWLARSSKIREFLTKLSTIFYFCSYNPCSPKDFP